MTPSTIRTPTAPPAGTQRAGAPIAKLRDVVWRAVDERGDLRAITIMRALFGVIVIRHLWPDLTADVLPVERFHVTWWSWLPVPSPGAYRALTIVGIAAGAAMTLGLAGRTSRAAAATARVGTIVALAVVSYLLFVDMTGFAHNRGFLVWMLVGLALLPAGDERQRLLWPVTLLKIVVASVYLTSGATKLLNPDWRSGLVLWDRVNRYSHQIPFDGWFADVITSRALHHVLSPAAIAIELFLAVALWNVRTRLAAIWIALVFHASIEVAASVQTFSYSAIAALLIWVTPRMRDRTLTTGSERLAGAVRRLDWLARFRVVHVDGASGATLVDRDGTSTTGRGATLTALSRLPLLFVVAGPLLGASRRRRQTGGER